MCLPTRRLSLVLQSSARSWNRYSSLSINATVYTAVVLYFLPFHMCNNSDYVLDLLGECCQNTGGLHTMKYHMNESWQPGNWYSNYPLPVFLSQINRFLLFNVFPGRRLK